VVGITFDEDGREAKLAELKERAIELIRETCDYLVKKGELIRNEYGRYVPVKRLQSAGVLENSVQ
jgi:hypothetical protein